MAVVLIEDKYSEAVEIRHGVKQGVVLSLILFNHYSENIFRIALNKI